MSIKVPLFLIVLFFSTLDAAAVKRRDRDQSSGLFSLGTRNTFSLFSDDYATGLGIGGQFRLQVNDRLNTEWFADYITSKYATFTLRNDYHIGWSVMLYPGHQVQFNKLLQPYLLVGHCFDYTVVSEQADPTNHAQRTSMATQAGIGTHVNFSRRFDCSISAQYMLHFGKEIESIVTSDAVEFEEHRHGLPHGHLLATISFNYKFADLW